MRLLGSIILVSAALCANGARAQSFDFEDQRLPPADGRLTSAIQSPGSRGAWTPPDEGVQSFTLRWKGEKSDWDVSSATRLVEETRANAVDFQTAGLFEAEGAIVRRVGDFRIGAVGYSARTVNDKAASKPRLGPMRWQGSAVGPVVGYDTQVMGKPATLSVRWYREIDATGPEGDTVSASFAVRF